jgi:hypothetical protein
VGADFSNSEVSSLPLPKCLGLSTFLDASLVSTFLSLWYSSLAVLTRSHSSPLYHPNQTWGERQTTGTAITALWEVGERNWQGEEGI